MHIFQNNPTVKDVRFTNDSLVVDLSDGRSLSSPLAWFPRLASASPRSLHHWERIAAGHGIHWPELDEDISVAGLLFGQPAHDAVHPFYKHEA